MVAAYIYIYFQNMPKPSAQGRAKIAETTAPGTTEAPTPDDQPPQDAGVSNALMANLLATLMAKIDDKFDEFRREQSTHGPVSAMQSTHGPASGMQSTHGPATIKQSTHCPATIAQSTHGPVASTSAEPARRRHRKRVRSLSPDRAVNSSDSDELTDNNSPAEEIERAIHHKAKCQRTSKSGTTAFDMGWAQLGDEVTVKLRKRILSNEYFPLRILRTDYDLDPQEDPASPTTDRKRAIIPVDQVGEWLHLFMTYAAIRSEQFPEEGSQLMTYMDHIITMHAQKGPLVWLEYDYRFRVRRERTGAPWNVFNYPLYSSVKAKCKTKAANTSVTSQPFRDYVTKSTRPHPSRFCYNFNKGRCSKRDCNYTHGCSFCKKEGHSQLVCKAKLAYNRTHYKAPPKAT